MGRARLDISVEILAEALAVLPRTFRIVASDCSRFDGEVTLILESDQIADDYRGAVTCLICDVGCTRTVTIQPVR